MYIDIISLLIDALLVVGSGFALGIGFWIAKKFTMFIDEFLLMHNPQKVKELLNLG